MLVKCPGCYTAYRVGDNLIGSSKPTFRCSRCKLIFALDLKSKTADEPDNSSIQTTLGKSGEEPSLPFPSSTEATAKDNEEKEFLSREKTESAPTQPKESQSSGTEPSLSNDPFAQRLDPFAPSQESAPQSQDPLHESQDSITEIQRFLAESQEPPAQDPETFNRGLDFPMTPQETTAQNDDVLSESQESETQREETSSGEKDEPLSAHEFFAKSQESLDQEENINTQIPEPDTHEQETFYTPVEESVEQNKEPTAATPMDMDPFDLERESPSRQIVPDAEEAPDQTTTKAKVRAYKGKTFGIKKKGSALTPGGEDTGVSPEPHVERRRPPIATQETHKGGPVSVIPYISLFGILLLTFSLVTLVYQAQPAKLEVYLKSVPWFGPVIFKNSHLRQGVILESLRSGFQKILGGRQVFVISGKISNRNPVSVREIRLEGLVHTAAGKQVGRQTISVGNPISSKIIRDMTVREIAILQRLKPQKRFEIAPDGSAAFTIVFLRPPKDIKSFSCRVLTTKGEA